MLFSDDEYDDLPDVPVTDRIPATAMELQAQRLQQLQSDFAELKEHLACGSGGHGTDAGSRRRSRSRNLRKSSDAADPATFHGTHVSSPHKEVDEAASFTGSRDDEAQYELRRIVPHLTPAFSCSYRDTILLLAAIQNGGGTHSVTGSTSLMDRVTTLEAEKRSLEQRMEKKMEECGSLKNSVAEGRQKVDAVIAEARRQSALSSQKNEELRKQLLQEEGRTQKMQVRNRKLEVELESLKERLRSQLR